MEQKERYLALRIGMMPRDTNPYGVIFGGVILSYIDQAAHAGAQKFVSQQGWPNRPMVSVSMNAVEFHKPVLVGDEVSLYTRVIRVGRSSLTIHIDVEATRDGQPMKMTEAEMTFVAVELDGDTRRAVPLRPES